MNYMWVIYLVFQFICPVCGQDNYSIHEAGRYETKTEAYIWSIPLVNQKQTRVCINCETMSSRYPSCATIQINKAFFDTEGIPKPLVVTQKSKSWSELISN